MKSDADEEDENEFDYADRGNEVLLGVLQGPLSPEYWNDVTTTRGGGVPIWCGGQPPKSLLRSADQGNSSDRSEGTIVVPWVKVVT